MYCIKSVSDNGYYVKDTIDGTVEMVSYEQLKNLVLNGVSIDGCAYKDRESLRKEGFWFVNPVDYDYTVDVKKGISYRVTAKQSWGTVGAGNAYSFVGTVLEIDAKKDLVTFLDIDHHCERKVWYKDVIKVDKQKVTPEIQALVKKREMLCRQIYELNDKISELRDKRDKLQVELDSLPAKLSELDGKIRPEEFKSIAIQNISDKVHQFVVQHKGRIQTPCEVSYTDKDIFITFSYVNSARQYSFIKYNSYDGSTSVNTSSEEYSRELSRLHKEPLLNGEFGECIVPTGRGNEGYYQCWYRYNFEKCILTIKEAEKFGGRIDVLHN